MEIHLNRTVRRHLEALERRKAYLEHRIAIHPEKDLSFDKSERAALIYAIDTIRAHAIMVPKKEEDNG